tara:strand:- start:219 stop:404 length:186 start_codon:yes stop_codon:yes gene_type:complete
MGLIPYITVKPINNRMMNSIEELIKDSKYNIKWHEERLVEYRLKLRAYEEAQKVFNNIKKK